ncbi:hypothetical protein D3C80_1816000 [compost metagenome]
MDGRVRTARSPAATPRGKAASNSLRVPEPSSRSTQSSAFSSAADSASLRPASGCPGAATTTSRSASIRTFSTRGASNAPSIRPSSASPASTASTTRCVLPIDRCSWISGWARAKAAMRGGSQ